MAGRISRMIELWRPVEDRVGSDDLELEGHFTLAVETRAWFVELSADRAYHALGTLTDTAVRIRVRNDNLKHRPIGGWRVVADGQEYAVRSATQIGGLWNIMAERL